MQCTGYRQSIHELVDETIGPIRRAELEHHLESCPDCRTLVSDLQEIRDTAASLDPLEPPAAVWLQIAAQLHKAGGVAPVPVRPWPVRHAALLAIAAALVLAIGASIVVLLPRYRAQSSMPAQTAAAPAGPTDGNAADDTTVQGVETEFRLAEQHYQNAIAKLEQAARLDQEAVAGQAAGGEARIDPQTAAMLQKNLHVIDSAIAESRAALRAEPQSAPARDSLFDALKRKVALLQDTIALMNEMRKGNAAGAAQIIQGSSKS
jgi:anti-sigma factor RsiW